MKTLNVAHSQKGAALLVALVMLLIATIAGLASIRGTSVQERMSANMYDRSIAFQAAEAAIRAGEEAVLANPDMGEDCFDRDPDITACNPLPPATFTGAATGWTQVGGAFRRNNDLMGGAVPEYFVQRLGTVGGTDELGLGSSANCDNYGGCDQSPPSAIVYRITGRSGMPNDNGRAVVALQVTLKQNL